MIKTVPRQLLDKFDFTGVPSLLVTGHTRG